MIPSSCQDDDLTAYIQAFCKSDVIEVPYFDQSVTKEDAALYVVLFDLLIGLIAVISFSCLRFCQDFEDKEIIETTLSADDFAVTVKNLPRHDNIKELKAFMWKWTEDNLKKNENRLLIKDTDEADPY